MPHDSCDSCDSCDSPTAPALQISPSGNYCWRSYIATLAVMFFWMGVVFWVLGSVISFYPGAEVEHFGLTGLLVSAGFLVPNRKYQIAAFIFLVLCMLAVYSGYHRGVEYQEWLQTRKI